MPRKANYGVDYDVEDYEDYEDYDEDYAYNDVEDYEEPPQSNKEIGRSGLWRCSICTYDNEESLSACDICGVLRQPLTDHDVKKVPFQFNVPSPDDMVSRGLHSSKAGFKANVDKLVPARVSSGNGAESLSSSSLNAINKVESQLPKVRNQELTDDDDIELEEISTSIEYSKVQKNTSSSLESNMKDLSVSKKPVKSSGGKGKSAANYVPEKWMLPSKSDETLSQLNLAIVGHVDSGKSTLSGRLLHLLGKITQKEMHKFEKEAKIQGKGSFAYAWALDESNEERERGITMNVAVAYFDTQKYHVVVLDSPGHKDFVPNMISGATQADAAILVIDSISGAFEAGMDNGKGQTREHSQLIRSFGVDQIIVAVNKMDGVGYSEDRFNSIKSLLGQFLRTCNFKDSSISWVPISSMENQNLISSPSDSRLTSWYQGPHLLNAIDSLQLPTREFQKPLLMPVCDVVKSSSAGHVSACGKLEAGAIRPGVKVLVMPCGETATVKSLERDSTPCHVARAGDSVVATLSGVDSNNVVAGCVICHVDYPVAVSHRLEVKVLAFEVNPPIVIGTQLEIHIHHAKEAATVSKMISLLDSKTGKVIKKMPRCITSKQSGLIEVVLHESVCVEEFSDCRALGRVFLRSLGRTIAVGVVTKVIIDT